MVLALSASCPLLDLGCETFVPGYGDYETENVTCDDEAVAAAASSEKGHGMKPGKRQRWCWLMNQPLLQSFLKI